MPPTVRRSATIVLLGGAAAVLGVTSVAIARHSPAFSFGGDSTAASAAEIAAGWALCGAGLALWARRPSGGFGLVLTAAGLTWFLAEWSNPGIGSALLFTIGLVGAAACPAVVGHAALAYPGAWPRAGVERWAVALAYAGAVIGLGVLPALSFDPPAQGCGDCPANLLSIGADPDAFRTLGRAGIGFGVVWACVLVVLAAWGPLRASPARRRLVAPVLAPAGAYFALVALDYVHGAGRGFLSNDRADRRLWLGEACALVALAAGVAWARTRRYRTRSAIAGLVVELGTSPAPGGLRDVLAGLLGDPSLELVYARDGEPGWVDANGLAVAPARDGAVVTRLVTGQRPLAALVHRPGLLDDPGLAHEIARAARLALEHERLQAETRAQLERLRASRARIVATGDAQRRRLERDLHDGAQQRMVTLALQLRLAGRRLGGESPERAAELGAAEYDLLEAVGELREIAHGIHPMALTDGGLAAGVEALAERGAHVVPGELSEERFHATIESAAYYVITEALRQCGDGPLGVEVRREGDRLVVDLQADGALPAPLTDFEDRVGALDGTLLVERGDGHTHLRAELPCA